MKNEETTFGVKPICCRPTWWQLLSYGAYGAYRSHRAYKPYDKLRAISEAFSAATWGGILLFIGLICLIRPIWLISLMASANKQGLILVFVRPINIGCQNKDNGHVQE